MTIILQHYAICLDLIWHGHRCDVKSHCDAYLQREVLFHIHDAWIDYSKTKVGYEIPLDRYSYVYHPSHPLDVIEQDIKRLETEIMGMLKGVVAWVKT